MSEKYRIVETKLAGKSSQARAAVCVLPQVQGVWMYR
jgi:hypothetical protein